ncbi:MAG: flagellar biosynthesis protein FlhA [Alphaproteobacteria bacterium]|nr:flagellar biosynthesis protein FlhA [Alphaproteobacteria bacterium]MBU0797134.1 flagellar biosynthesis protein FlhA [Alphaproteobacteria bacterium]MBU0888121.1 flagellar biosynthesis protein FlhA [Alphaproteobacteria bacterium]MBU1811566.1 flagellar biosynthesis protein FlhA [Alphaproteobacteria bacterium]
MADTSQQGSPGGGGGGGSMGDLLSRYGGIFNRPDIAVALGMISILSVLILPMPTWLLDIALALSLTFSVLILMTVMFIHRPLDFNAFPTILLIATMLRLALNLASTRLILSEGHTGPQAAGDVIASFGAFMMGGNYVIGVIVFAILVLVNFIVITKGAGRIAEVGARFSLDAMPGKQMAIDADLSSGLINEDDARIRRKELEEESTFFGAMDGASKFVRGDAIAGLLITFINVIGGMIIGVAQQGLTFGDAARTYTLLTVGDGLVSQIPALIVSTAAGMLVSKSGTPGTADKQLIKQLGGYPTALGLSSFLMLVLGVLPGLPFVPFFILSAVTGAAAYFMTRSQKKEVVRKAEAVAADTMPVPVAEEPISTALHIDLIRLELGYGLLPLINSTDGQRLTDQIKALRRQLASELGFIMPSVRIQDNLQLAPNTYLLRIKEIESGRGDIRPNMLLVMDPRGQKIDLPGEATREPTFGLPAMWINPSHREEALFRGYTVVDPPTVITTHLTEIVRDNMADLLSYTETQKLLDELSGSHQKLVADVVPGQISVGGLQRILQNLLTERISIRDLPTILEGISEAHGYTRNVTTITEHVRSRLARQLSEQYTNEEGHIPMVTLSPDWEQAFADSIVGQGEDKQLSMPPTKLQQFIASVRQTFEQMATLGEAPVLLTSPVIRPYVRSIIERFRPATVVLSQNEIHPKAKIKTLGQI